MYYVYVLQSRKDTSFYVGLTRDLRQRMNEHQQSETGYTKGHRPLILLTYTAFPTKVLAAKFERYLKSGSGRAFLRRHFVTG